MTVTAGRQPKAGWAGGPAWLALAALACAWAAVTPAAANDGWYSIDPAGLSLTQAKGIAIVSEKLEISFSGVKVRYRFRNLDDVPKTGIVGFPIPHPGFLDQESDGPGAAGVRKILDSFTASVNGKPVPIEGTAYQVKALALPESFAAGGAAAARGQKPLDITALLRSTGIRLDDMKTSIVAQLEAGPKREKVLAGLPARYREAFPYYLQGWLIPYWKQDFGPGETLTVEHSYRPIPGGYLFTAFDITGPGGAFVLPSDDIAMVVEHIARERGRLRRELEEAYGPGSRIDCSLGPEAAADAIASRLRVRYREQQAAGGKGGGNIPQGFGFMTYVFETARSWDGPIASFEMTLDGEGKPLLFCFPAPIETLDAARFVYRTQLLDFAPRANLSITRIE